MIQYHFDSEDDSTPVVKTSDAVTNSSFQNYTHLDESLDKLLIRLAQLPHIQFNAIGKISAQANDSYTFTLVLFKIHLAISSFSHIFHLLNNSLNPVDNPIHPLNNWSLHVCSNHLLNIVSKA